MSACEAATIAYQQATPAYYNTSLSHEKFSSRGHLPPSPGVSRSRSFGCGHRSYQFKPGFGCQGVNLWRGWAMRICPPRTGTTTCLCSPCRCRLSPSAITAIRRTVGTSGRRPSPACGTALTDTRSPRSVSIATSILPSVAARSSRAGNAGRDQARELQQRHGPGTQPVREPATDAPIDKTFHDSATDTADTASVAMTACVEATRAHASGFQAGTVLSHRR